MNVIDTLIELSKTHLGIFQIIATGIIIFCALAIFSSILINFIEANKVKEKRKKKSIVETGSMLLFFLIFYFFIRFNIGSFEINSIFLRIFLIIIGLFIIILGCFFNIQGRLALGKNWANQIKIYDNHTLITKGVYGFVRHPLYASLIWMFYGACLIYLNYAAFLSNTFIFIPFMYYRAKQEEKFLSEEFKNYEKYKLNVGIFFPRLKKVYND